MLEAKDLSFCYAGADQWALKDVCLKVEQGQCLVLGGSSGCGKSTLVKALCGLIPHFERGIRAGRVFFKGADLADLCMHQIAENIGAVFQNPRSQFFTTSVCDEIAFGCENLGLGRREILKRLERSSERFGLDPLKEKSIFQLSNGERQKVIMAAIHAMGPDLWVMDEPSSNLDPRAVAQLTDIIKGLKQEGKTLIIAEHRCHYLKDCADRVVLMEKGRIVSDQSAKSFFSQSNEELGRQGLRWAHIPTTNFKAAKPASQVKANQLKARELAFRYGRHKPELLKGLNLQARGGEILGVTGANGAGKTTLAMVLTGLLKERGGKVRLNGELCKAAQRARRCRMVLQESDHQLFAQSAEGELALALGKGGAADGRIKELLAQCGLDHLAARRPQCLSGGEKQRLVIAAALATEPEVLALDEPTSGLDAGSLRQVGDLLKGFAARGGVVLVVTHDYEFILSCCTSVIRLDMGRATTRLPVGEMPAEMHSFLVGEAVPEGFS